MWEYYDVVNFGLVVLIILAAGYLSIQLKFAKKEHIGPLVNFVFKVALPAMVCRGIGFKTDLYQDGIWRFIGAFLVLRFVMLLLAFVWRVVIRQGTVGEMTAEWLATTWISTVLLGSPAVASAYGDELGGEQVAQSYGMLAGVSSFLFQLPLMMLLFEYHAMKKETTSPDVESAPPAASPQSSASPELPPVKRVSFDTHGAKSDTQRASTPPAEEVTVAVGNVAAGQRVSPADADPVKPDGEPRATQWMRGFTIHMKGARAEMRNTFSARCARALGTRVAHNNVLWGIALGFVLSLSTAREYINPPKETNPDFVEELEFLDTFLDYLGRCATPVALFATGMWMHGRNPLRAGVVRTLLFLFAKLLVVPLLMIPLVMWFDIEGAEFSRPGDGPYVARAAVLIASIPISLASFTLASEYELLEDLIVACVFFGTILLLPIMLLFVAILDTDHPFANTVLPPLPAKG